MKKREEENPFELLIYNNSNEILSVQMKFFSITSHILNKMVVSYGGKSDGG